MAPVSSPGPSAEKGGLIHRPGCLLTDLLLF